MWPEAVERVAAVLRASGLEGRLEELLPGAGPPAGQKLRADRFDGDGATVVALVPAGRTLDEGKLAAAAGCRQVRRANVGVFPFEGARVFMDQSALSAGGVWLEAGSPRHVVELSPVNLARLTRAETADLVREG
jgi:prolyl-tRNA editing enzyme YbaK/EbsC (Cys-tRNA(Pro) deacylase)